MLEQRLTATRDRCEARPATLVSALGIASGGVVCFVGAGGKKTLMYSVADTYPGRVAITAATRIERFPRRQPLALLHDSMETLQRDLLALEAARTVAIARPYELRTARHGGLTEEELVGLHRAGGFSLWLVKADGARGRLIKAPAEHEPSIAAHATHVVPVVSARVIGERLSERVAHRTARVARAVDAEVGETLRPTHIARLLASAQGSLKSTHGRLVTPVINMVDDPERERLAREAATAALAMTDRFDRVVLTAMKAKQPVVGGGALGNF